MIGSHLQKHFSLNHPRIFDGIVSRIHVLHRGFPLSVQSGNLTQPFVNGQRNL